MYKHPYERSTMIEINQATPGEMLETKVERLMHEKSPMEEAAVPLIYTPRSEGIRASTNIRTDRWEVAIEATDKIQKSYKARREENRKMEKDREANRNETGENKEKTPEKGPENKA
ncbi:MAG: hypothetical protein [Microviridae sp.]|nr:MAG: hypothetical protein [Microviridae sp.]